MTESFLKLRLTDQRIFSSPEISSTSRPASAMVLVSSARANGGTNGAKANHNGQYEEPRGQLIHNPINTTVAVARYMIRKL